MMIIHLDFITQPATLPISGTVKILFVLILVDSAKIQLTVLVQAVSLFFTLNGNSECPGGAQKAFGRSLLVSDFSNGRTSCWFDTSSLNDVGCGSGAGFSGRSLEEGGAWTLASSSKGFMNRRIVKEMGVSKFTGTPKWMVYNETPY